MSIKIRCLKIGDKIFQEIQYKNGWVWVDGEKLNCVNWCGRSECFNGCAGTLTELCKTEEQVMEVIIAQSPELTLEGVPVVNVETIEVLAEKFFNDRKTKFGSEAYKSLAIVDWVNGYKEAQSKGCYTEEQMRDCALKFFYYWWNAEGNNTERGLRDWLPSFLQSIQPVIKVETEKRKITFGAMETASPRFEHVPVTYIENGRVHFKLIE